MDTPGTGPLARCVTLVGHMAAGRNDAAAEIAAELRSTLPTLVGPIERYWATFAILQVLDPDTIAADAEAALTAARTVGAPQFIGQVLRNVAVRWFFADPPNFDRAFAELDEAIRLHDSVGTSSAWEWMVLTWGRTLAGDTQVLDTLNEAVVRLYDERQWAALDATLEAAPVLLGQNAPAVAATIHGYLEGSEPPWGQGGLIARAAAAKVVDAIPDNDIHRARGATMDRHDVVALTLATLDDN